MNGREVFRHAVKRFPEVIREGLSYNNLNIEDVGLLFLIKQIIEFQSCSEKLKVEENQKYFLTFINMEIQLQHQWE